VGRRHGNNVAQLVWRVLHLKHKRGRDTLIST
jgi:hypothetical protein